MIAYLDSSAFVKLVKEEDESAALAAALSQWPDRASSRLLRVEVLRAARLSGEAAFRRAAELLEDVALLPLADVVLERAVDLRPAAVRSLDAIHLATARELGGELGLLITYDVHMLKGAEELELQTLTPV